MRVEIDAGERAVALECDEEERVSLREFAETALSLWQATDVPKGPTRGPVAGQPGFPVGRRPAPSAQAAASG